MFDSLNSIKYCYFLVFICGIERIFGFSSLTSQVKTINDVFNAATKLRTDWNIGNAAITNVINILRCKSGRTILQCICQ